MRRHACEPPVIGLSGEDRPSCCDILMMTLGFLFARRVGVRASVTAVVAMEVFCLLWVRDNLTLNVVMLIHPIEAIKARQSAGQPLP